MRARLTRLEALQARSESVLSHQVVSSYEADRPDIVVDYVDPDGPTIRHLLPGLTAPMRRP